MVQIYQIYNTIDDETFIGVSKNMYRRLSNYRNKYIKVGGTSKLFKHFEKHGTGVFRIRLLGECNETDVKDKKREYLRTMNPSLNQKTCLNTDELKQYKKQYRETNKETIKTQRGMKYTCECGSELTHDSKMRHSRTKKHTFMEGI